MAARRMVLLGKVWLGILALANFSSDPVLALEAITTPILESAPNFRDLAGIAASMGGTGYVNTTSSGGVVRTGIFYRTDALNGLNTADWTTLSALHIYRDIDLRTPNEIYGTAGPPPSAPAQDVVPSGTIWTNINIYGTQGPIPSPFADTPANAVSFMQAGYQAFVIDPVQRNGFRTVLLTLAHDPGPDIWHCSGGKDRTGWTSVLLQSIAGVSEATIMQDYLATNRYTAALMNATKASLLLANPSWSPETIDALLGVQSGYLQAGLDQVIASYGSMAAYLTQGLGLTQADIYVLRAKMVYFPELPGQGGLTGNAASGAALLNALQNSPLSGHYTDYNYYLQSAVDRGTLGGVEARVGGQVYADAASFLLRQAGQVDALLTPYTVGRELPQGQPRFWMLGNGGYSSTSGHDGIAGSQEHSGGPVLGATYRINRRASVHMGFGATWGSVESADAEATVNSAQLFWGGRYGFSSLDAGPFVEGRMDAGWVDYDSDRVLGAGLGTASGSTGGYLYGAQVGVGNTLSWAPLALTPKAGLRVSRVSLDDFNEGGSDLALKVRGIEQTMVSLIADLDCSFNPRQWGEWIMVPRASLGYERILGDPQTEGVATLYDGIIPQKSAFDSHDLLKAGIGLAAEYGTLAINGTVNGLLGEGTKSTGIYGLLSLSYTF